MAVMLAANPIQRKLEFNQPPDGGKRSSGQSKNRSFCVMSEKNQFKYKAFLIASGSVFFRSSNATNK